MEFVLCPRKEKQKSAPMVLSVSCLPGGVIWILDDTRLSPTENFKVWTRSEQLSNSNRRRRRATDRTVSSCLASGSVNWE